MTKKNAFKSHINKSLLLIIILAALLRIAFLGTAPISFSVDEASNGYDTYSIMETMRDRYGVFLPFFTKALSDYRETLYIFLTIPIVKFFGLNEFAIRLPSALIGTLTVPVVYYLTKECFNNKKIALLSALLFAISPWHIFFSRLAFRAILLPFLFSLAVLLFIKSFKKPNYLPLSALIFGLSLYTYSSARGFVPPFMLILTIIFWRHFWNNRRQTLMALSIFMVIFIPMFMFWITPEGMARATTTGMQTNLFSIIKNYLSYFDPGFLFINGDPNPRRSVSGVGVGELYLFELATVLAGIYFLSKTKTKERSILLLWLFLYPMPAAAIDSAHAIRAIVGVPLFSILSGYGLFQISSLVSSERKKYFKWISIAIVTASFTAFLNFYFNYSQYIIANTSKNWQYGMKEAINFAETSSYNCTIVSDKFWRPNIYILFYTKYPPTEHQKAPIEPDVTTGYSLGKYQISSISQTQILSGQCLFIIQPNELKEILGKGATVREIKSIATLDGVEKIKLVEVNVS
ncbi:glycosyltransferase family 39 protein [Kamptonema animale CS-326]|jgi:4-amino-4-deoxy-L-arabinose transferase-like glycosyltransferase|uniref:glycosyltransferase family 39 protein n=1 Tax=Kamptonema animale TaxID=92934 RepID=UPI00232E0A27|nr:glycosyltransferase family 39 protein [Kamptonema animale]MDB9514063.1 glycosyltransferase family 39 protein [Kamptonema animale CS-326]